MPLLDGSKCRLLLWVGAIGQALGFALVFAGFTIKRGDLTALQFGFLFAIASGLLLFLTIIRAATHSSEKKYLAPSIALSVFWLLVWTNLSTVGAAVGNVLSRWWK